MGLKKKLGKLPVIESRIIRALDGIGRDVMTVDELAKALDITPLEVVAIEIKARKRLGPHSRRSKA